MRTQIVLKRVVIGLALVAIAVIAYLEGYERGYRIATLRGVIRREKIEDHETQRFISKVKRHAKQA